MTSGLQQLLKTLRDYSTEEQHEFLEIVRRLNIMVQNTPKKRKKMQQDRDLNRDEEKIIDKLTSLEKGRNYEVTNQTREIPNMRTKGSIRRKKNRHIQCYKCKERGHVMKNCPYSPRVIMQEQRELTSELKNALVSKFGVSSCSHSVCQ